MAKRPVGELLLTAADFLLELRSNYRFEFVGSIRRGLPEVGDIDVLVEGYFSGLEAGNPVPLTYDSPCVASYTINGVKIDIFSTFGGDNRGEILTYATGPREFNYLLDHHHKGLRKPSQSSATEEEYFAWLGIPWAEPSLRHAPEYLATTKKKLAAYRQYVNSQSRHHRW